MRKIRIITRIIIGIIILTSCKSFLDVKPDQKLQIPSNLTDMQSILDYHRRVGTYEPTSIEVSADDYYVTDEGWRSLAAEYDRRLYLWSESNVFLANRNDWSYSYENVYRANAVLEEIDYVEVKDDVEKRTRDNIKGQALALRGRILMKVAFIWSPVYSASNENLPFGIPLKLDTDFNQPIERSTVGESYRQIEADLLEASRLLPNQQVHIMRTSRAGAFGLLSRLYLVMGEYQKAYLYADSCLQLHGALLDYNEINRNVNFPVNEYNSEVVLHTQMLTSATLTYTVGIIDSNLYRSYHDNDLRRYVYFKVDNNGLARYYGSYSGTVHLFDGIATDEMLLNRAEAAVRLGRIDDGMADLNRLLVTRWKRGEFVPYTVDSQEQVLSIILQERRKSLLMRGIRWTDLKRLNREGDGIVVERFIEGKRYVLRPNDPQYALPIPEEVITISGISQNPR